jgi:hypothetical protein
MIRWRSLSPTTNSVNASLWKNQKSTGALPTDHTPRHPKAAGSGDASLKKAPAVSAGAKFWCEGGFLKPPNAACPTFAKIRNRGGSGVLSRRSVTFISPRQDTSGLVGMTDALCQLHHAGSSDRSHAFGGGYGALATQVTLRRAGHG